MPITAPNCVSNTVRSRVGEIVGAPSGFSGFETAFSVLHTKYVKTGKWTLADLVKWMTSGPAAAFDWTDRGGFGVGQVADLVLINPEEEWTVDPDQFFTRGKACPFDGWKLTGKVMGTMVNGEWVYKDGEVQRAW